MAATSKAPFKAPGRTQSNAKEAAHAASYLSQEDVGVLVSQSSQL